MPKIPKVTRWTRFVDFIKGILLYNTVYWSRASDGLRPPKATRDERREKRPKRDLTIIKPREKPRAKLDTESLQIPASAAETPVIPAAAMPAAAPELRKKRRKRRKKRWEMNSRDEFTMRTAGVLSKLFKRRES